MTLKLVTGTPGAGKTLFTVNMIFSEYLSQPVTESHPRRQIYSNINGLNIPGVLKFPDREDFDWRQTPIGSVIIYDEAQLLPSFTKSPPRDLDTAIRDDLTIHRHTGHDIVLITQNPALLHPNIIHLVQDHFHVYRVFNMPRATVFQFGQGELHPNSRSVRRDAINNKEFRYPKQLYNFYKSSESHNMKLKIPLKYIILTLLPVFILIFVFYKAYHSERLCGVFNSCSQVKTVEQASPTAVISTIKPSNIQNPLTSTTSSSLGAEARNFIADVPQISACVASYPVSEFGCYCKDGLDRLLNLTMSECYSFSKSSAKWTPLPKNNLSPQPSLTDQVNSPVDSFTSNFPSS